MAIAGRVAIVPKGDWSADDTYKRLDAVTYNNTLYFAKKNVPAGTVTSNTEYWTKSIVGSAVTVDDALSSTSTNPVQNKVVTSNLTDIRKETTVNLLKPTFETVTQNGVTCTNNGDGTYTLNGTATSEVICVFLRDEEGKSLYKNIVGKTLKFLNGGSIKPPVGRFLFTLRDGNKWWHKGEHYDNSIFTVSEGYSQVTIDLHIYKNQTLTNVIVKPMLTTNLSATYDDFVPYTGDTGKLNGDVAELKKTINGALPAANVVNNQTTTEGGYALDARQANPNINGTLAKQISDLNGSLNNIILANEVIIDPLDINNLKNKLYMTNPNTKNLPDGRDYGFLFVVGADGNKWRLLILIPTSLQAIYINHYNAYGDPAIGWIGWHKISQFI